MNELYTSGSSLNRIVIRSFASSPLKGLFPKLMAVNSTMSADTWYIGKIALYVGCTTYSSEWESRDR